jgi:hypothetical protein
MTTEIDELDRLYEALTIEGKKVSPECPSYYCRGRMIGGWWGRNGLRDDLEYRNSENNLHRIYGPAYISYNYKIEEWYKDGELHRLNGPARTHKDNKWYYVEGKLHRLDGPAVDASGRRKEYWIGGQQLSPKNYKKEIERRKRKGLIK